MMEDILTALRALLELGAPAIYLIMLFTLWRENRRLNDLLVEVLRERSTRRVKHLTDENGTA